jgi:hypothetical protein
MGKTLKKLWKKKWETLKSSGRRVLRRFRKTVYGKPLFCPLVSGLVMGSSDEIHGPSLPCRDLAAAQGGRKTCSCRSPSTFSHPRFESIVPKIAVEEARGFFFAYVFFVCKKGRESRNRSSKSLPFLDWGLCTGKKLRETTRHVVVYRDNAAILFLFFVSTCAHSMELLFFSSLFKLKNKK